MKHILVDFNTVMQDAAEGIHVTLGQDEDVASGELPELFPDEDVASGELPELFPGEHVIAFDDEMEVEGVVEREGTFWVAALDWATLKRCVPSG